MAFSGCRYVSGDSIVNRGLPYLQKRCMQISRPSSFKIHKGIGRVGGGLIISKASTDLKPGRKRGKGVIGRETLDLWMRKAVVDIVKNLQEAPLLVNVYSSNDGDLARLETERTEGKEDWSSLKRRWESGEATVPEGVIFVEQIEDYEEGDGRDGGVTKSWGIVVQGRGAVCGGPACYLLKTSRVSGGAGLGFGCTHFCLVKVKNFRETAKSQLKNCWLLQSNLLQR